MEDLGPIKRVYDDVMWVLGGGCKLCRNNHDRLKYKYYWSENLANKYIRYY